MSNWRTLEPDEKRMSQDVKQDTRGRIHDRVAIASTDANYPAPLRKHLDHHAPAQVSVLGNLDILQTKPVALFCSVKCPGNLILQTYDLAQKWRDQGVTVISGFHSPME